MIGVLGTAPLLLVVRRYSTKYTYIPVSIYTAEGVLDIESRPGASFSSSSSSGVDPSS